MSQGLLCLATPGSSGLGHEEEGMRREGGSPVTARHGFPVLSLTPSLQSWECSGVSGETEVCLSPPGCLHGTPPCPLAPELRGAQGCSSCSLGLPQPCGPPWPFSQVLQTLIWALGSRLPGITGQSVDPPTFLADTRMNHVGMGEPTALPLSLSFRAGRNVVRLGGNPCAGEGADRLGAREALPPGWS